MWTSRELAVTAGAALGLALLALPRHRGERPWTEEVSPAAYAELRRLAGRVSAEELSWALGLLDPWEQLAAYVDLEPHRVRLRATADGEQPDVEVALASRAPPRPRPASMEGLRVLLDPGHMGGAWSEIEQRHLQLDGREPIREGDLAYGTAVLLAARLEAAGAEVRLTRGAPPEQGFPAGARPGFDAREEAALELSARLAVGGRLGLWQRLYPWWGAGVALAGARDRLAQQELFALYNRFDLRQRALMAEQWPADVTLSLHYNMGGSIGRNCFVVFIPGSALPGELQTSSQRFYALRRALEGRLPEMAALAGLVAASMARHLDLEPLQAPELKFVAVPRKQAVGGAPGVYARNLAVLRRAVGPVLLVEGPFMDHPEEYARLQERELWIDGRGYPRRVADYADAVFEGLAAWLAGAEAAVPLPPGLSGGGADRGVRDGAQ